MSILREQAKLPFLHFFAPCNPHGLQLGVGCVSIATELLLNGPNPKSNVVEQNTAVTAASTAEHKCNGAESFV